MSNSTSQTTPRPRPVKKIGWVQAARLFFTNKEEVGLVSKLTTGVFTFLAKTSIVTLPFTVLDEPIDAVPGLGLLTMGDDVLAVFGAIMLIRIAIFRSQCNRRLRNAAQPHRAQPAYER